MPTLQNPRARTQEKMQVSHSHPQTALRFRTLDASHGHSVRQVTLNTADCTIRRAAAFGLREQE